MNLADATIGQLAVPVTDLERSLGFYRDTLGLPLLFTAPPQMAFFRCGEVRLLVGAASGDHAPPGGTAIYFRVADIQAVHGHLAGQGVEFINTPHVVHRTPGMELWLAEFRDPDGNLFALMGEVRTG